MYICYSGSGARFRWICIWPIPFSSAQSWINCANPRQPCSSKWTTNFSPRHQFLRIVVYPTLQVVHFLSQLWRFFDHKSLEYKLLHALVEYFPKIPKELLQKLTLYLKRKRNASFNFFHVLMVFIFIHSVDRWQIYLQANFQRTSAL